jgi:GxxExxY protein
MLLHEELSKEVIGAAIEVHKTLGPGLLENVYEECLCRELQLRHVEFARQVILPVEYKGITVDCAYRMDIVVQDAVVVEIKCVKAFEPVHEAQLLTYLRLSGKKVGLLMNFHVATMRDGILRRVL